MVQQGAERRAGGGISPGMGGPRETFFFPFFFPPVRRATISSRGIIVCSLHQGGKLPTSNLESCAVIKHASAFLLTLTGRNVLE